MIAAGTDAIGYVEAIEAVLESFESRDEYLEDVPVADTVIVLAALAAGAACTPTSTRRCCRSAPGLTGETLDHPQPPLRWFRLR